MTNPRVKVFRARVTAGRVIYGIDAIEHQGKLWLVPNWIDSPSTGRTTPARIIRFDNLRHQDVRGSNLEVDFVLNDPIPTELLADETPKQPVPGFEYIEMPALSRRDGDKLN